MKLIDRLIMGAFAVVVLAACLPAVVPSLVQLVAVTTICVLLVLTARYLTRR